MRMQMCVKEMRIGIGQAEAIVEDTCAVGSNSEPPPQTFYYFLPKIFFQIWNKHSLRTRTAEKFSKNIN